jgi:uncharacterized protein (DUF302 family)
MMIYYINRVIESDFDTAIDRVTKALKNEGFGVVTKMDVQKKLNNALDVDFRPYVILGACNPEGAYKALQHENKIGVLLPCNVIIQQLEKGKVEIAAVDPYASMMAVENQGLAELAEKMKLRLTNVVTKA